MKKWLITISIASAHLIVAQNSAIDLEQFAERLFQIQDEDIAYEDIYESLLLYYSNKLNLNKLDYEELASLYLLNPHQLNEFFEYREQFGRFLSINELQAIPSFDLATIRSLLPFVTVKESSLDTRPFLQRLMREENNYLLLRLTRRLEEQVGYTPALPLDTTFIREENDHITDTITSPPNRYLGDQNKLYGRFRTSKRGDFSLGFTFEKDAGEQITFNNRQNGFDFYSYHLLLENKLGLDKIMLGDFQVQAGQGIVYGAGFNPGKGAETINTAKRSTFGMRPYTSVLEGGFFRGAGVSKSFGDVEVTVFYSRLRQDGTIRSDTVFSPFDEFVSTIQTVGLHRTENEIGNRNRIIEESFGGLIHYQPNRRRSFGIAGLNSQYSTPLQRTPNNYNQFEFKGDHNYILSAFGHYTWQNFTFFGEAARSGSGGVGAIGGLVGSLSQTVDFAMLLRNYDRDFHSFYGNAFSENSRNINEKGVYWGLAVTPNRHHKLNLYYDRFSFPWLKFGTEAPSVGNEWLARYTYRPNKKVSLYTQIRQQTRQVSIVQENLNILADRIKFNYLFNIDYQVIQDITLKTKIQSSHQDEAGVFTKGFAIIQDVNFQIWVLKFNTRMALFETDNFANAQYVFENDVLYSFSLPPYYGAGIRNYAMIRFDPLPDVSLWIRYARSNYRDRNEVGSGLETSLGNTSTEVKLMARIKF